MFWQARLMSISNIQIISVLSDSIVDSLVENVLTFQLTIQLPKFTTMSCQNQLLSPDYQWFGSKCFIGLGF